MKNSGARWNFQKTANGDHGLFLNVGDKKVNIASERQLAQYIGSTSAHSVIDSLRKGETSGEVKFEKSELYSKTYDRELPKIFEKLTGEKMQVGTTLDRNGKEVKVYYSRLGKLGKKNENNLHFLPPSDESYSSVIKEFGGSKNITEAKNTTEKEYKNFLDSYKKRNGDKWSPMYTTLARDRGKIEALEMIDEAMKDGDILSAVNSRFGKYSKTGHISNYKDIDNVYNTLMQNFNKVKELTYTNGGTDALNKKLSDISADMYVFSNIKNLLNFSPTPLPIASNEQQAKDFFNV